MRSIADHAAGGFYRTKNNPPDGGKPHPIIFLFCRAQLGGVPQPTTKELIISNDLAHLNPAFLSASFQNS
jgi:hypothetical protein